MHGVALDIRAEVSSNRAGRRLGAVRFTDEPSQPGNRVISLQHHGHYRTRADPLDELGEKRLVTMHTVKLSRRLLGESRHVQLPDHEAFRFHASNDLPDGVFGHRIGFDNHQGPFHAIPSRCRAHTAAYERQKKIPIELEIIEVNPFRVNQMGALGGAVESTCFWASPGPENEGGQGRPNPACAGIRTAIRLGF